MIVMLKDNPKRDAFESFINWLKDEGIVVNFLQGSNLILELSGNTDEIDADVIAAFDIVEYVKRGQEPYKKASRSFHPEDTVIDLKSAVIGGGGLALIAGPCSVESEEQIIAVARAVKASGATLLRGGAFKPRTSPYTFQGMGKEGIRLLEIAKEATGLPIVTEIMEAAQLPLFDKVDIIQVGARDIQNFSLLKALGEQDKPVMLKRGLSTTYEELLMSAEYVMAGGNERVILCERGIRSFESYTRNTLDLSAVPVLKRLTHLPVIVDPSHATGRAELVAPMATAAVAAGADGLLIEVHNDPAKARSDGKQSILPKDFDRLAKRLYALHDFLSSQKDGNAGNCR